CDKGILQLDLAAGRPTSGPPPACAYGCERPTGVRRLPPDPGARVAGGARHPGFDRPPGCDRGHHALPGLTRVRPVRPARQPALGVSGPAAALLRWQFWQAHQLLDAAVRQCPTDAAPHGAACYARAILCEDIGVNGVLAARSPLALSTWAGRTGLDPLPWLG